MTIGSNEVSLPDLDRVGEIGRSERWRRAVVEGCERLLGTTEVLALSPLLGNRMVTVADVGASVGFNPRWCQLGKNLRIHLFEPNPDEWRKLKTRYAADGRVMVSNTALSERGEPITIHVNAWPYSSSVFRHDQRFFRELSMRKFYKPTGTLEVGSSTLDDAVCGELDFIKIDIEGSELPVLRGGRRCLSSCVGIETEVSYARWAKDLPLFGDVDAFCQQQGFTLCRISCPDSYHLIVPSDLQAHGIVFSGDALYFRSPSEVISMVESGRWPKEKIVAALAVYLVYGNVEFAHVLREAAVDGSKISASEAEYARNLIDQRSGRKQRLRRRLLRRIRRFLRVPVWRSGLDHAINF